MILTINFWFSQLCANCFTTILSHISRKIFVETMGDVTDDEPILNLIIERYLRVRVGKREIQLFLYDCFT